MEEIDVLPIWADSMGAKSMCVKVETSDTSLLIDPAAAVMQKSFPLKTEKKYSLLDEARGEIEKASEDVEHIFISHYHYDHHFLPDTQGIDFEKIFSGKRIWMKDPNRWINHSQWRRSRKFLSSLLELEGDKDLDDFKQEPEKVDYRDPLNEMELLHEIEEEGYAERRRELHGKWREQFVRRRDMWNEEEHIKEPLSNLHFADSRNFEEENTKVRFTDPLFHGIEYSKTGWVLAVVIEKGDEKFIYTSDLQGPTIEDYGAWLIDEDPDFLIMDGPATYLLGYMLNQFNLERSIKNAERIIEKCDFETLLYDHHLTREKGFREKTEHIWHAAEREGKEVLTYSEYLEGEDPLAERIEE